MLNDRSDTTDIVRVSDAGPVTHLLRRQAEEVDNSLIDVIDFTSRRERKNESGNRVE
jgi:hypothetical protein